MSVASTIVPEEEDLLTVACGLDAFFARKTGGNSMGADSKTALEPQELLTAAGALDAFARVMVAVASGLDETDDEWDEISHWEESYAEAVERFKRGAPKVLATVGIRVVKEVLTVLGPASIRARWEADGVHASGIKSLEAGDEFTVVRAPRRFPR
jgi:hypothetical protein